MRYNDGGKGVAMPAQWSVTCDKCGASLEVGDGQMYVTIQLPWEGVLGFSFYSCPKHMHDMAEAAINNLREVVLATIRGRGGKYGS
jgi:hypothetical protein